MMITRRSSIGTFFRPQPAPPDSTARGWKPPLAAVPNGSSSSRRPATLGLASTFRRARRLGRGAVGFVQAPPHQALQLHDGLPHAAAEDEVAPIHPERDAGEGREGFPLGEAIGIAQLDSERPRLPGRGARVADGLDFVPGDRVPTREQLQPGNRAPTRKQLKTVPGYYEADRVCEALRVYDGSPQTINGHDDSAGDLCHTQRHASGCEVATTQEHAQNADRDEDYVEQDSQLRPAPVVANGYCGTEDGVTRLRLDWPGGSHGLFSLSIDGAGLERSAMMTARRGLRAPAPALMRE